MAGSALMNSVGNFKIVRLIGKGGERQVFEAVCARSEGTVMDGERVALNCLKDREHRLFQREAEILASLNHPNILRYRHAFVHPTSLGDLYCLVTELLEGETLADRILRNRYPVGIPWAEARSIFSQILEALQEAARLRVVHRDLKPSNIYLCQDGTAKLIDFGIAGRQSQAGDTKSALPMQGSFDYMAPEYSRPSEDGFEGDSISDVFSFGVSLYQTVTGRLPFEAMGHGQVDHYLRWTSPTPPIVDYSDAVFRVWPGLRACLAGCLEPNRERRFSSFSALAKAFDGIQPFRVPPPESEEVYEYVSAIGSGAFGEVFQARHLRKGVDLGYVAVKRLVQARYSRRFEREAAILRSLNHPNLVRYVDFRKVDTESGAQYFLILEYLKGETGATLRSRIQASADGLDPVEMFRLFSSYLDALDFLNRNEIIHRDIKPHNLYAPQGDPAGGKIFDLGIALDQSGTQTSGMIPGSWDYMAPELSRVGSERGTPQSDIYSLGVTLYQALTGRLPYPTSRSWQEFAERAEKPLKLGFDHKVFREFPGLDAVFQQALAQDPVQRYPSARAMHKALGDLLRIWQLSHAQTDPGDWSIVIGRAESAMDARDWPESRKRCELVLEQDPQNARAQELLAVTQGILEAEAAAAGNRWSLGMARLRQIPQQYQANPFLRRALADMELRTRETSRSTGVRPNYGRILETLEDSDVANALQLCAEILKESPEDPDALQLRQTLLRLQTLENLVACKAFSKVLPLVDADDACDSAPEILHAFARLLARSSHQAMVVGDLPTAERLIHRAASLEGGNAEIQDGQLVCRLVLEAEKAASESSWWAAGDALQRALSRRPGDSFLQGKLLAVARRGAEDAIKQGDYEKAKSFCEHLSELSSMEPSASTLTDLAAGLVDAKAAGKLRNWQSALQILRDLRRSYTDSVLGEQSLSALGGVMDRSIAMAEAERAREARHVSELIRGAEKAIVEDPLSSESALARSSEFPFDLRWAALQKLAEPLRLIEISRCAGQWQPMLGACKKAYLYFPSNRLVSMGLAQIDALLQDRIVEAEAQLRRQQQRRWMLFGFALLGLLCVGLGAGLWIWKSMEQQRRADAFKREILNSVSFQSDAELMGIAKKNSGPRLLIQDLKSWWSNPAVPFPVIDKGFSNLVYRSAQRELTNSPWSDNVLDRPGLIWDHFRVKAITMEKTRTLAAYVELNLALIETNAPVALRPKASQAVQRFVEALETKQHTSGAFSLEALRTNHFHLMAWKIMRTVDVTVSERILPIYSQAQVKRDADTNRQSQPAYLGTPYIPKK